jgi:hypothetical protein
MSKIMRELYAEARVARAATARVNERSTVSVPAKPLPLDPSKGSGIEWWKARYDKTGRALVSKVTEAAIHAIQRPCTPLEHAKWWRERMVAGPNSQ